MTLALEALVIAGGVFCGRLIARVVRRARARRAEAGVDSPSDPPAAPDPFAGFPCKLGDVVARKLEGDEAWLAGAVLLEEERTVAVLFVAPEAKADRAVLAPGPGQTTLAWLAQLPKGDPPVPAEPPRSIEQGSILFERTRRLPVRLRRVGTGAPDVGSTGVFAEYAGPGAERLVLLAGAAGGVAWRGTAVQEGDYEVWPGSETSLESGFARIRERGLRRSAS